MSDTVNVNADFSSPVVTSFSLPTQSTSLTFSVSALTASDNTGVTGYLINESASTPAANDPDWSGSAPTSYTATGSAGPATPITVYAWAKDADGNISSSASDQIIIDLDDTSGAYLVGPYREYHTLRDALTAVGSQTGKVIEVDAGEYVEDDINVNPDDLTIRGKGGYAHFIGTPPVYKAILDIYSPNITLEYLEISEGKALEPYDLARGIVFEPALVDATVRHCKIHGNDTGLSAGTGGGDLLVEYSEFYDNGYGEEEVPGNTHNVYIGEIETLTFQYNYSHDIHAGPDGTGHLFKTRAHTNYVLYNRLTDEGGGASRLMEFSQGGYAYAVGNILHKSAGADHGTSVSYGPESLSNPGKEFYFANNTIVSDYGTNGKFFYCNPGSTMCKAQNNILVGTDQLYQTGGSGVSPTDVNNLKVTSDPGFVSIGTYDYRLASGASGAIDQGTDPGLANGFSLVPTYQYEHASNRESRPSDGTLDMGAYEYQSGGSSSLLTVFTQATSSITQTTATINGTITAVGSNDPTVRGAAYGLSSSYGSIATQTGSFGTGAFSVALSGLVCETTYHAAPYATDSDGTAYGSDTTFTTSECDASSGGSPSVSGSSNDDDGDNGNSKKKNKKKSSNKTISSKVTVKPGERIPPWITIVSHRVGSVMKGPINISVRATDKSGIQAMILSVNGVKRKRVNGDSLTYYNSYSGKFWKKATISVFAYDSYGNRKNAEIFIERGKIKDIRYAW